MKLDNRKINSLKMLENYILVKKLVLKKYFIIAFFTPFENVSFLNPFLTFEAAIVCLDEPNRSVLLRLPPYVWIIRLSRRSGQLDIIMVETTIMGAFT
uniref:Uncharacterized protein n=1 Tax=Cyanothece sp. (strain PCC 7425 / ATCC 29141) TaxID=395961 RepID=B8HVE4_CYAP4